MENKNSIYYGLNSNVSKNIIRKYNPSKTEENVFIFAKSGSGMQFFTKIEQKNKEE